MVPTATTGYRSVVRRQGPLAENYWAAVVLVILALTPFLVLTSAVSSLNELIGKSLHLSEAELGMTTGMANAAYCFGTVLSIQLITRLRPRLVLLVLIVGFVAASVAAAWAPSAGVFIAGRVVQGLTTSMMLIAAVPPLVIGWPKRRSAAFFDHTSATSGRASHRPLVMPVRIAPGSR